MIFQLLTGFFDLDWLHFLVEASQALSASAPFLMASSGLSPSDMQPGKSGKLIRQPPPSALLNGASSNVF